MKKLILSVLVTTLAVMVAVSQEKPWTEWSKAEAEKVLDHSGWGQTQTETDTSEMIYSPTASRNHSEHSYSRRPAGRQ